MDSALEARVSDSNERLEEYLQGALRSNALESFALVAPHRDGYRVYVGEDVERPFAYVDVYLDGESLIVEGSSKRHLSEAEMGDLARFLGIDGKEAGMKLNRFRRFVDALRSMSGSDVDALRKLRVSDCVLKDVRRTKVEDADKTWPEVYLERLRSVPVPEGRGSLSEEEKERILDQRIQVALSSIVSFLSDRGYRTSLDDLDITVEGADGKAYLHLNGMDRGNGFLSINIDDDPKTHYHDVVSVDAWFSLLKDSLGDRVSDSQEPGEGFKLWADSESAREVPAELDIIYTTADDAYDAAVNFVHSFDGEDFRVIIHVSSLSDEFEGDIVESFPKGSVAYREVYLGGIEDSTGGRRADSASSSLHLGDTVLLSDRADEPYRSSEFKIVDMNLALGLAGLMREGDSHIYPAPISELSLVSEQDVKNVPAGMLKDSVESDAELLESLRSDSSPANLKRVAHILKDQGRTSLKDGNKEVMAIAEYSNGQLVYSYKQKAWQEVKDSEDAWKDELREVYSAYEDGSILGSEIEERLEFLLSDNDVPSDVADEIYGKIDEFVLARKHASRSGGRESDGREEFESWFSQFCSKLGLSAVADSAEKSEAELASVVRDDARADSAWYVGYKEDGGVVYPLGYRPYESAKMAYEAHKFDHMIPLATQSGYDSLLAIATELGGTFDRSHELLEVVSDSADGRHWWIEFDSLNGKQTRLYPLGYRTEDEIEELMRNGEVKSYPFEFPTKEGYELLLEQAEGPYFDYIVDRSREVIPELVKDSDDDDDEDGSVVATVSVSWAKRFRDMLDDLCHLDYSAEATNVFKFAVDESEDGDDAYDELADDILANMRAYGIPEDEVQFHVSDSRSKVSDSEPRRDFIFPADSTVVTDGKGHFPLNSLARGRAALAFVARYDKLPKWYSGDMDLEAFKAHVRSEVKKAYPSIEVSEE